MTNKTSESSDTLPSPESGVTESDSLFSDQGRSPLTPTFPTSSSICDVLVIGGGIVGLDTALRILQSRPQLRLVLLEKESHLACHQRVK